MKRTTHLLCFFFLASAAAAAPQDGSVPATALGIARTSSAEVMQRPLALTGAAGKLHQKVSTRSPEAQAYYDQGLAYLHSYVWVEAARSFHEALRRDPDLAMAHLGLARACIGATAYQDAFDHLRKASQLAAEGKTTAVEAKWIELGEQQLEALFAAPQERTRKQTAYKRAADELIVMDSENPHAWVLRGNAEEADPAAGRGQGGGVGAVAYYEAALKRDPDHFGAHHYLVHSYENLGLYEKSAEHAGRYADAVPGVAHAQHMYGHVLPRLGRWEKALEQFQKADRLHREYFAAGVAPVEEWHHGHNLQVMGAVELRLRHDSRAEALFEEAFYLKVRSVRDGRFTDPWLLYLLLRGRYQETLEAAAEAEERPLALARLIGAVRAAEAHLALGQMDQARAAQERAGRAFEDFRRETDNPVYISLQRRHEQGLLEPLKAQFALLGGRPEEGERSLIALADRYAAGTTLDGWVTGLFHLEQLVGVAERLNRPQLAAALLDRIRQIDSQHPLAPQ